MHSAIPTNTTIAPNDSILQRLDREHAAAFEIGCRLQAEAVEADGGDVTTLPDDWKPAVETYASRAAGKASHAAWLAFEALGGAAAASFPAETLEGFRAKVRILERQAQGMPAHEIIEEGGARGQLSRRRRRFARERRARCSRTTSSSRSGTRPAGRCDRRTPPLIFPANPRPG